MYGMIDKEHFTYWSIYRYPAAHNGSTLNVDHLKNAVPEHRLVMLDMDQKLELVSLLEAERKVIRNITSMFIRNYAWKKALTLNMRAKDGQPIRHVRDILDSMVHDRSRLNWAKGFTSLRLQFEGREWIDDLEREIQESGFGGTPIRYLQAYDSNTGLRTKRKLLPSCQNVVVPNGKKKPVKFTAIANQVKRKFQLSVGDFKQSLYRRTGLKVAWRLVKTQHIGLCTSSDMEALAMNLEIAGASGTPADTAAWGTAISSYQVMVGNTTTTPTTYTVAPSDDVNTKNAVAATIDVNADPNTALTIHDTEEGTTTHDYNVADKNDGKKAATKTPVTTDDDVAPPVATATGTEVAALTTIPTSTPVVNDDDAQTETNDDVDEATTGDATTTAATPVILDVGENDANLDLKDKLRVVMEKLHCAEREGLVSKQALVSMTKAQANETERVELAAAKSLAQASLDKRATDVALKTASDAKEAKAAKAKEERLAKAVVKAAKAAVEKAAKLAKAAEEKAAKATKTAEIKAAKAAKTANEKATKAEVKAARTEEDKATKAVKMQDEKATKAKAKAAKSEKAKEGKAEKAAKAKEEKAVKAVNEKKEKAAKGDKKIMAIPVKNKRVSATL
jgi:hypothetical protein